MELSTTRNIQTLESKTIMEFKQFLTNLHNHIESLIHGPTIEQCIEHEEQLARATIRQTAHTIKTQEYLRHMAKSKLNAIDDWNAGNIL